MRSGDVKDHLAVVFGPLNTTHALLYVLGDMVIVILLFVFGVSQLFERVLVDEIDLMLTLSGSSSGVRNSFRVIAFSEYAKNLTQFASVERRQRDAENLYLLMDGVLPLPLVLGFVTLANLVRLFLINPPPPTEAKYVAALAGTLMVGYAPTVLFWAVVISRWRVVGDLDVLTSLLN